MIRQPNLVWFALLVLLCGYLLVEALRKGHFRWGREQIHRTKEPTRYWTKIILLIVFCVLGLWIVVSTLSKG